MVLTKHQWASLAAAACGVLTVVSCQTTAPLDTSTQYLAGLQPPARPQISAHQAMVDTVSYWDGDGVSGTAKIEIDLSEQQAYFYKGESLVGVSKISTGTPDHATPPGNFKVTQKSPDHKSSAYGNYVDSAGNVVVSDVDSRKDKRPPGTRFDGAPMPHFLRFNHGIGMHAGHLPGYPASHGCVRMPDWMAAHFFNHSQLGTPVIVRP